MYLSLFEETLLTCLDQLKQVPTSNIYILFKNNSDNFNKGLFPFIVTLNDFPERLDIGFQDPATGLMESLILLHHDIMFFELIILVTVFYFLYFILYWYISVLPLKGESFYSDSTFKISPLLNITHAPELEIVWTSLPAILLTIIAIPSILLLFRSDRLHVASLIIKIVGNQWYWHFDYYTKIKAN